MRIQNFCRAGLLVVLLSLALEVVGAPGKGERILMEYKSAMIQSVSGGRIGFEWLKNDPPFSPLATAEHIKLPRPASPPVFRSGKPVSVIGVLTDPQFRTVVHAIETRDGTDVVTLPRQFVSAGKPAKISFDEAKKTPVFDSTVEIHRDNDALRIAMDAILNLPRPKSMGGGTMNVSIPVTQISIYSGQTVMMSSLKKDPDKKVKPVNVVLFVTATRVDENGTALPRK